MESELSGNLERYRQFIAEAEASPDYWNAVAAYEFVRELERRLEEQGVSRAELARRLGTSKAYVTKVLSADANFTLATMNRLAAAVGGEVHVRISDRRAANRKAGRQPVPEPEPPRPGAGEEPPADGRKRRRSKG
ncbi:MAG TPA: helix-turn-helix transcriptional regulator [Thermoanaerobaculia bacterium]|jgi:transcriptional regulator with XRE-family HTH domain|nr:helix-turn-helix transcriptional regulator [Thermoanaerobaculia bacterium]